MKGANRKSNSFSFEINRLEEFNELSRKILRFANEGTHRIEFLEEVSKMIIKFSGCDEIEIWLRDGKLFYRWTAVYHPQEKFRYEIFPKNFETKSVMASEFKENKSFIQLCVDILNKDIHTSSQNVTKNGSVWFTGIKNSFSLKEKNNKKSYKIARHIGGVFKSIAIIPFVVDDKNSGLLHLNSKQSNFFFKDDITFFEIFAQTLGIAVANRRAHWALGERIKELKCLYDIKKVVERSGVSKNSILAQIVNILPPAWQFPEITNCMILVDGRKFYSTGFVEGFIKQTSDIIIDNKKQGYIEINYSEERPEQHEGPFLLEERHLIDNVAKELALIIEQKQNEEERLILQEQIRHADRLATIGQLAAGVAHEINEPLGNILGFAQLSQKHSNLPQDVNDDIEKIITASLHAREIVKKLLLFARQAPKEFKKIDLNELIDKSLYFYEHRCEKEGIELHREFASDLPIILGDPSQLVQVLVNLVINAIQAMPNGGKLTVRTNFDKTRLYLNVIDTGIGMDDKIKNKIFLPFFTTKDVNEGTGLGLAIVHDIVTAHNGIIKVHSKKAKGTSFELQFPLNRFQKNNLKDN